MLAVKVTDVPAHIVVPVLVDTLTVGTIWAFTVKADDALAPLLPLNVGVVAPIEIL